MIFKVPSNPNHSTILWIFWKILRFFPLVFVLLFLHQVLHIIAYTLAWLLGEEVLRKVPRTGGCHTALAVPSWHTHPRHRSAFGFLPVVHIFRLYSLAVKLETGCFHVFYFLKGLWPSPLYLPSQNWNWEKKSPC